MTIRFRMHWIPTAPFHRKDTAFHLEGPGGFDIARKHIHAAVNPSVCFVASCTMPLQPSIPSPCSVERHSSITIHQPLLCRHLLHHIIASCSDTDPRLPPVSPLGVVSIGNPYQPLHFSKPSQIYLIDPPTGSSLQHCSRATG